MNNDYYLQEINIKLGNTNNYIQDIIENQEAIIENQQILISGDIEITSKLYEISMVNTAILTITMLILIYNFVTRCWKC